VLSENIETTQIVAAVVIDHVSTGQNKENRPTRKTKKNPKKKKHNNKISKSALFRIVSRDS
jgi:hypothetical protein